MLRLEIIKEGVSLEDREISLPASIGRLEECSICLSHPSISRKHAQIIQGNDENEIYLQDLGSVHGTCLNKRPLEPLKSYSIHDGDQIRFGKSTRIFIVHIEESLHSSNEDEEELKRKNRLLEEECEEFENSLYDLTVKKVKDPDLPRNPQHLKQLKGEVVLEIQKCQQEIDSISTEGNHNSKEQEDSLDSFYCELQSERLAVLRESMKKLIDKSVKCEEALTELEFANEKDKDTF